ncbi:MAG: Ig-like domain-containing protein, partial [Patescibacteria group bacterium]
AVITPEHTWLPNTTYTVEVKNVRRMLWPFGGPKTFTFTFTTQALPAVAVVQPGSTQEIPADQQWDVVLDRAIDRAATFEVQTEPAGALTVTAQADQRTLHVQPQQLLTQGQPVTLVVSRTPQQFIFDSDVVASQGEPEEIHRSTYTVRQPPGLSAVQPQGAGVALASPVRLTFSEPVAVADVEKNVAIAPKVTGNWSQVDAQTVQFAPSDLVQATTYTVSVPKGLKTTTGGFIPAEVVSQFRTIEPVAVTGVSPAHGSGGVRVGSKLRYTFNQVVDHASAEAHFRITPKVEGTMSWAGNVLSFTPKTALTLGTAYSVTLGSGITSPAGLPSTQDATYTFSTELAVTRIAVPFHRQERSLSCEAATAVMALRYYKVSITEKAIIDAVGFDRTKKQGNVWGNPHVAFVGDINGRQPSTGYGVYWQPIAKAISAYRPARWFTGWSLRQLLTEVEAGHPVIVWGTAGSGKRIDWKTPSGGNVVAVMGEHVFVVMGYIGSIDNPQVIITQDPLSGEHRFTKASFLWNWGVLGNSGVVVE